MCTTCGCSDSANPKVIPLRVENSGVPGPTQGDHVHSHEDHHDHHHEHHHTHDHPDPPHEHGKVVSLEQALLAKNDLLAERNRGWFLGKNILALNLVSSPGSGKTTLLERMILDLRDHLDISVIEGDQETLHDAERIRKTGCPVVQINTGAGCHLEADMLARGLEELHPPSDSLLLIENVGNLVCPALFDLGEHAKVVILSVTEGEDKPLKYPHMFKNSRLMILNKIDLLPYLNFDVPQCVKFAKMVNPDIQILQVSAVTGEGLLQWYDWVRSQIRSSEQ